MKNLSKSQISLIDTLESLIQSDYFKKLMSQETIPPAFTKLVLKGKKDGSVSVMKKIADVLKVDLDDLV